MSQTNEQEVSQTDNKHSNQPDSGISTPVISKHIAVNSLQSIDLLDEKQVAAFEIYLRKIMKSSKGGISSVEDGFAMMMRAKDLNLPFSSCLEHVHVLNGKTGVDVHIIKALILRAGCTWECTKDYQPLYEYTDGINVYVDGSFPEYVVRCNNREQAEKLSNEDKTLEKQYVYPVKWYQDGAGNFYKDYQLDTKRFGIAVNRQQIAAITSEKKIAVWRIPSKPVDYITEYKFERVVNGKLMTATSRFSYLDAITADLFSKDTYKKYARILIGHRAFTYGARDIASDVLFGVMETTELKIMNNQDISDRDTILIEDADIVS